MALSKKHFQAIARIMYDVKLTKRDNAHEQWDDVVRELARWCAAENEAFDRERFIEACETGTTRGMRS